VLPLAVLVAQCGGAAAVRAEPASTLKPLQDDELSTIHGADGFAFNLQNFSLTSLASNPLSLTYQSPDGGTLTLGRLDLSRTDDADPFADPFYLHTVARPGMADVIALDFPQNPLATGHQQWTLTTDFSNCSLFANGACTGTDFEGGTLQVAGLAMRGGGLTLSTPALAGTDGIAFGLGTRLDIDSLGIFPRGRDANDVIDTSESLVLGGLHLADAATGGAWMLADVTTHPGLFNAETDATGSYLHLQIAWPTIASAVTSGSLQIDTITFTSGGTPTFAFGAPGAPAASIASMQINYMDIKLRP
jgi:hypothetical protein